MRREALAGRPVVCGSYSDVVCGSQAKPAGPRRYDMAPSVTLVGGIELYPGPWTSLDPLHLSTRSSRLSTQSSRLWTLESGALSSMYNDMEHGWIPAPLLPRWSACERSSRLEPLVGRPCRYLPIRTWCIVCANKDVWACRVGACAAPAGAQAAERRNSKTAIELRRPPAEVLLPALSGSGKWAST